MLVGGDVGPELTRIGSKVKPEWLAEWLRNPKTYDPETAMPHYRFDQKQLAPLRAFLEAKTDSDFLANVHLEPATPEQIAHGKALGDGARLRLLPRNQRHQEAGQLRARS